MKNSSVLITGGCGFVGRNLVRKLTREKDIWIVDDLSIGQHPTTWLGKEYKKISQKKNYVAFTGKEQTIHFIHADAIDLFTSEVQGSPTLPQFKSMYHLASIVGGRELIDGDPILVGKDLAIDSLFFHWVTRNQRDVSRVLYASSSAAYPNVLQGKSKFKKLKETDIAFEKYLGMPDMTYGWSKLTGEYLSRLAAQKYGIRVACIRPFSGFGEDQDFSYPVPAIARRVALRENPMTVWGSGKQGRDFVHISDCIDAFFIVMRHISDGSACNIGTGKLTSFLDVIKIFTKLEGYSPKIVPLLSKPVGVSSRVADPTYIFSLGWKPKLSLEEGFGQVLTHVKTKRL